MDVTLNVMFIIKLHLCKRALNLHSLSHLLS